MMVSCTDASRDRTRSSVASCSTLVTMIASGPGNTSASCSVSSHRTIYGADPSGPCTSVIIPRCSDRSLPLTTSQSPTLALIAHTFRPGRFLWCERSECAGKGRMPSAVWVESPSGTDTDDPVADGSPVTASPVRPPIGTNGPSVPPPHHRGDETRGGGSDPTANLSCSAPALASRCTGHQGRSRSLDRGLADHDHRRTGQLGNAFAYRAH
jgi:hypothetical protein